MHDELRPTPLIDSIPDPQTVRERLASNLRETHLLRQLLKLSERAEHERENQKAVQHAR